MSTDILNFDNGLEVDATVDQLAEKYDEETIRNFFMKAENTNFLVPHRDAVNVIPLFNSGDGLKLIPAFSSYAAFEKSPLPKDKVSIMHLDKIKDIVKNSGGAIGGIIINPHGKSLVFRHKDADVQKPNPNSEVKLMKPAFVPEEITTALREYFSSIEKVYSAYVLWAQKGGELAPHLFLVVDFDGAKEEFFPKVAEAIKPVLKSGGSIEMAKADFKLLKTAEKLVKPLYKKP
ncbi:MAG: enhanced serine sensitivity protein SseB C-terminal domain-containing protein [Oscillospiraceae bacterium]|nr:enhanced serine sensitivity protein SseB C-terminal domain-containing protein [Oscillospiraceae bacterium]